MQQVDRADYPEDRVQRLVSGIPFFNEILRDDEQQFRELMERAEILQASPGELVIRQGAFDRYLYFLLKGQLAVMADNGQGGQIINYISPGEVFGTLAMLRGTPRTATILVDESAREAVVARLDYGHFSDISNLTTFSMETMLAFYRMVVHNIRWTLEVNRMQDPQHPLVGKLRKVPVYAGAKETMEELESLHEQANTLADILCEWNDAPQARQANVQLT